MFIIYYLFIILENLAFCKLNQIQIEIKLCKYVLLF